MSFRKIDPSTYDWDNAQWAQKTAIVEAEAVEPGTKVETVMKNGLTETVNTATDEASILVTNPSGEQYLVNNKKFNQRYDKRSDVFTPKAAPVKVIPLEEGVSFTAPWGEEMKIEHGGVLVNAGGSDIYGIQKAEFKETYETLKTDPSNSRDDATKDAERLLLIKSRATELHLQKLAKNQKKTEKTGPELG